MDRCTCSWVAGLIVLGLGACAPGPPVLDAAIDAPPAPDRYAPSWTRWLEGGSTDDALPDFSSAGYRMGETANGTRANELDVRDFGAIPDDGVDDVVALQAAIDRAGELGGAVVRLPAGRFDLNVSGEGPFIEIHDDGVVVRGEGPERTELHLARPLLDVRRDAALYVRGSSAAEPLAHLTAPARRGDRVVEVDSTASLEVGAIVRIELLDAEVDPALPDPARATLAASFTAPFPLTSAMSETIGAPGALVSTMLRIEAILDTTHVRFARPLRMDHGLETAPTILGYHPVREVGIEGLRITTAWPGEYRHHRPYPHDATGDAIVRTTEEQDYLWTAIQLARAADCWVRDVVIRDANQGIMLYEAAYVTIEDVRFEGNLGHVGVGLTRTHDSLVQRARFDTRFVHSFLAAVFSSGNVVTASEATVWGHDEVSTADSTIDHHGLFPYENLYDDLRGFYVVAGGPSERLPHAGVRNTFWNLEVPDRLEAHGVSDELFRTYATSRTSAGEARTNHELWPESFVVGVHRMGGLPVLVGGSPADRHDAWLTVEGTERTDVLPHSLYCAQRAIRDGRSPDGC